jgi:hypothetical protein
MAAAPPSPPDLTSEPGTTTTRLLLRYKRITVSTGKGRPQLCHPSANRSQGSKPPPDKSSRSTASCDKAVWTERRLEGECRSQQQHRQPTTTAASEERPSISQSPFQEDANTAVCHLRVQGRSISRESSSHHHHLRAVRGISFLGLSLLIIIISFCVPSRRLLFSLLPLDMFLVLSTQVRNPSATTNKPATTISVRDCSSQQQQHHHQRDVPG